MQRTYFWLTASIAAIAALTFLALHLHGTGSRRFRDAKRVGIDAIEAVEIARPQEALRSWSARYHGRIVLSFDATWPTFDVTSYYTSPLYRAYPLNVYNIVIEQERKHLSDANFLYFAALRGTVRDIRAVLSPAGFAEAAPRAAAAKNSRVGESEVYSTHHGLPRTLSTLSGMTVPKEPVLLYVSASFFATCSPDELILHLRSVGVTTDSVVVCMKEGEPGVTAADRNNAAHFVRLLRRPS